MSDVDNPDNKVDIPAHLHSPDLFDATASSSRQRPPKRPFVNLSPRKELKRVRREVTKKMASFIFFDIESTGLFKHDPFAPRETTLLDSPEKITNRLHKYTVETPRDARPRMTEISVVTITRRAFEAAMDKMHKKAADAPGDKSADIRQSNLALNIVTKQLNPSLTEEEWKNYENIRRPETYRLTRDILTEKRSFGEEWSCIEHAIASAPKPTCIVAHNGLAFDMRVLLGELEDSRTDISTVFHDEVLFADTLLAMREIDAADASAISALIGGFDWGAMSLMRANAVANIPAAIQEEDDVVAETPDELFNTTITGGCAVGRPAEWSSRPGYATPDRAPRSVGTTSAPAKLTSSRALFPEVAVDPLHPLNFLRTEDWTVAKKRRIQSKMFKKVNGTWQYDAAAVAENARRRGLFRQENLYDTIFNEAYMAHQAQDDCEALLQIALAYGNSFLDYADSMAANIPF